MPQPDVAAAVAAAKKEKRAAAAAAAMAPRMQSQVQKWAQRTAELGGNRTEEEVVVVLDDDKPKKKTKKTAVPLRAPHRRDRLVSFGGNGQSGTPVCLLCRARFATPQQLRDHEVLSPRHRRRLRDAAARRAAVAIQTAVYVTRRLPRRRGDPPPVYTSYGAPIRHERRDGDTSDTPDPPSHACLHCRRRFRRRATLRLHERESALHRARLRDPAAVAAAVAGVDAAAEAMTTTAPRPVVPRPLLRMRPAPTPTSTGGAAYRDRARERRQAFGKTKSEAVPVPTPPTSTPAPPSKGAALLGKMGWAAGQGLGAHGAGPTAALAPEAYRAGVGLGADGGRLGDAAAVAARRTEAGSSSYADFVAQAQEAARQRYQALEKEEEKDTETDTKDAK